MRYRVYVLICGVMLVSVSARAQVPLIPLVPLQHFTAPELAQQHCPTDTVIHVDFPVQYNVVKVKGAGTQIQQYTPGPYVCKKEYDMQPHIPVPQPQP